MNSKIEKGSTFLCIGPMSKNCVDSVIELAYEYEVEMMLIASRRQIECKELGGGYVNNWDTLSFAQYVKSHDPLGRVVLARDHGGPWQHPIEWENCKTIDEAMTSAKLSFQKDIEAGFKVIHIDPVINNNNQELSMNWVLDKVRELYKFCIETARHYDKDILIEVGTEEQSTSPIESLDKLEQLLDDIIGFCEKNHFPKPTFVVVQTGTKVMEMKNIGDFPSETQAIQDYVNKHRFSEVIAACETRGIKLKEHNADYLSDNSLKIHPSLGIHAANVAPEFGVAETNAFIDVMEQLGAKRELKEFIDICVQSNKWVKWVRFPKDISDLDKAKICGHYLFSDIRVEALKNKLGSQYKEVCGVDLDSRLKEAVKNSILRYMISFNMIEAKR